MKPLIRYGRLALPLLGAFVALEVLADPQAVVPATLDSVFQIRCGIHLQVLGGVRSFSSLDQSANSSDPKNKITNNIAISTATPDNSIEIKSETRVNPYENNALKEAFPNPLKSAIDVTDGILGAFMQLNSDARRWHHRPIRVEDTRLQSSISEGDRLHLVVLNINYIKSILRKLTNESDTNYLLNVLKVRVLGEMIHQGLRPHAGDQDYKTMTFEFADTHFDVARMETALKDALKRFDIFLKARFISVFEYKSKMNLLNHWVTAGVLTYSKRSFLEPATLSATRRFERHAAFIAAQMAQPTENVVNYEKISKTLSLEFHTIEQLRTGIAEFLKKRLGDKAFSKNGPLRKVKFTRKQNEVLHWMDMSDFYVEVLSRQFNGKLRNMKDLADVENLLRSVGVQGEISELELAKFLDYFQRSGKFSPPFVHANQLQKNLTNVSDLLALKSNREMGNADLVSFDMAGVGEFNVHLIQAQLAASAFRVSTLGNTVGSLETYASLYGMSYGRSYQRMLAGLRRALAVVAKESSSGNVRVDQEVQARISGDELVTEANLSREAWKRVIKQLTPALRASYLSGADQFKKWNVLDSEIAGIRDFAEEGLKAIRAQWEGKDRAHRIRMGVYSRILGRDSSGRLKFETEFMMFFPPSMAARDRHQILNFINSRDFEAIVAQNGGVDSEVFRQLQKSSAIAIE